MRDVILHPAAFKEFQKAFRWYHRRSRSAALRFNQEIQTALQRIAATPDSFPRIADNCRHLLLKRYRYEIVYRLFNDAIHVLAIAHGSRRPGYWKRRGDDPTPNGHPDR